MIGRNNLLPDLSRRKRPAWKAYKSAEDVVKEIKDFRIRAHLFNTTVLPALIYASKTRTLRKHKENAVSFIERSIEKVMLDVSRFTQVKKRVRNSALYQQSKIRDAAAFAKTNKIGRAGHVMRFNDDRWTRAVNAWVPRDVKRITGSKISSRSPSTKDTMLFVFLERKDTRVTQTRGKHADSETYCSKTCTPQEPTVDEVDTLLLCELE